MPIYATNNGNIGDYNTVSGVVSNVSGSYVDLSGDYVTTSGAISDYPVVSGDYASTSGTIQDYSVMSGDYAATSGTVSDYNVLSGDLSTLDTDYPITSGDYAASSGDLSDYKVVSGDFAAGGDGAGTTHITGLTGGAWSIFYSEESSGLITGLALGASGLTLSSVGPSSAPVWSPKSAGGGDDLGSHEAIKMLDMNTYKITGMGDPEANQDAATKIFVDNHNWTKGDITDLDTSGYENASGDIALVSGAYAASSGDLSDYKVVSGAYVSTAADYVTTSGDYSASSGDVSDYKVVSGVVAAGGGGITGISELAAQAWTMFYSNASDISGMVLGASGLQFSSMGVDQIPTWSAAGAGAGDNLGSHEADKMLDMNTFKITGLGDPQANQDAVTLKYGLDNYAPSGEYVTLSGVIDDYAVVSGDFSTLDTDYTVTSGALADYPAVSGDYAATSGTISDYAVFSGDYSTTSGDIADYDTVSGDAASALQDLSGDPSPQLAADLDLNAFNISVAPSFGSDHQHEGLVVSKTTDAGAYGQGLYMKSNGAYGLAQADAAGTMPCSAIWIASGKVLLIGTIRDDTWDFTVGGYVYISEATAGLFTTTAPSTATNLVQKVGIADSADSMYFNPGGFRTVTVA